MLTTKESVRLTEDEKDAFDTFVGGEAPKSRGAYEAAVHGAVTGLRDEAADSKAAMLAADSDEEKRDHAHNAACARLLAAITEDSLLPPKD